MSVDQSRQPQPSSAATLLRLFLVAYLLIISSSLLLPIHNSPTQSTRHCGTSIEASVEWRVVLGICIFSAPADLASRTVCFLQAKLLIATGKWHCKWSGGGPDGSLAPSDKIRIFSQKSCDRSDRIPWRPRLGVSVENGSSMCQGIQKRVELRHS